MCRPELVFPPILGILMLVLATTSVGQPPASQLKTVDVSLEPPRVCAALGETATVYVVVSAVEPAALGAVDVLFEYDPRLTLVSAEAVGCWFHTGFLNDPDGINDDTHDGEALFTLLGGLTDDQRMYATPCGTRIVELTFRGEGQVRLVDASGVYGLTRVLPPDPPNFNITGKNKDLTEVVVCGPRRVKSRRLP